MKAQRECEHRRMDQVAAAAAALEAERTGNSKDGDQRM